MADFHTHSRLIVGRRLGAAKADRLLFDAANGHRPSMEKLARDMALDTTVRHDMRDDPEYLDLHIGVSDGAMWRGETLKIKATIPETVLNSMIGQSLGSLVAGTGFDEGIIVDATSDSGQTCITVETGRMGRGDLNLPASIRLLSPLRKRWNSWTYEYLQKTHIMGWGDVSFGLGFGMLLIVATLIAVALAIPFGMAAWMAMLLMIVTFVMPLTAGMFTIAVRGFLGVVERSVEARRGEKK